MIIRQRARGLIDAIVEDEWEAALGRRPRRVWGRLAIQRCTARKLRNLEAKATVWLREELAEMTHSHVSTT